MTSFQDHKLDDVFNSLPPSPRITILTGAGISAESGLGTFRGKNGLWKKYKLEEVATPDAFQKNPEKVHEFYNLRRAQLFDDNIKPNAAHKALARLQDERDHITLVTQNVDNLHERAGSTAVVHMHGTLFQLLCSFCHHKTAVTDDTIAIDTKTVCTGCNEAGGLRPAVVWFGEMPHHMDDIVQTLANTDLFLSIGTSGHVYPAGGFVNTASQAGALTFEINLEPSQNARIFSGGLYGPATKKVPLFVNKLLETRA